MSTLTFQDFRSRFDALVKEYGMTWEAVGFLTSDDNVYPFGTDTKVISTVFEAHAGPLISEIAAEYGYTVEGAPQTIYPDFTLTPASHKPPRIAIDIKTTYRRYNNNGTLTNFKYTLGSYTSFLRKSDGTGNIRYPYHDYSYHWVIGFLYTRTEGVPAKVYRRDDAGTLKAPYGNVEYFLQEKYKIAGTTPGSGNTANIGSHPTNDIEDLREGRGPFAELGKEVCDTYWRNYGRTAASREFSNLPEFLKWRESNGGKS